MQATRFGILADVHGNRWALDSVLEHAAGRGVDRWLNLGDCVYGPLDPRGTAERLRSLGALTVRGNQDRILVQPADGADESSSFRFVRDALTADDLGWLATLPATARDGDVFLCHGTPRNDEEPLVEEIRASGVVLRDDGAVETLLEGVSAQVVLCGHTHVARQVQLRSGTLVVNPGSVGLPAYTDDEPRAHAMEAGSPHARYGVLERGPSGWTVEQYAVAYDWQTAAHQAERNGRPDWADWIRTGRASDPA